MFRETRQSQKGKSYMDLNIYQIIICYRFLNMGNKILKSLRVALLNQVTVIKNNKETEAKCLHTTSNHYKEVIQALQKSWPRSKDIIIGKISLRT